MGLRATESIYDDLPPLLRTRRVLTMLCALVVVVTSAAGSIVATTPTVALATSCRGVRITPRDDLEAEIASRRPRTTFCFAAGTYELNDTVWTASKFPRLNLRAGAVIDGQNGTFRAFAGHHAAPDRRGMVVLGGVFQNFGNARAERSYAPLGLTRNAVVVGTEFRRNVMAGLTIRGDDVRVSNVHIHHNGKYGLTVTELCDGCRGPVGVIIENSEIAYNNTRRLDPGHAAGGTKFWGGSNGMIVRRNEVHHNYGSGLWWDGRNRNADVYGNLIYANFRWGIRWEISYGGARIHDNTLRRNGVGDGTTNYHNAQIVITDSDGRDGGIGIYRNKIAGSAHAVTIVDTPARSIRTRHVHVHDNVMTLRTRDSRVGAHTSSGTRLFSAEWNNRFEDNTYRVPDRRGEHWVWRGETLTWRQWRRYGHDGGGAVRRFD